MRRSESDQSVHLFNRLAPPFIFATPPSCAVFTKQRSGRWKTEQEHSEGSLISFETARSSARFWMLRSLTLFSKKVSAYVCIYMARLRFLALPLSGRFRFGSAERKLHFLLRVLVYVWLIRDVSRYDFWIRILLNARLHIDFASGSILIEWLSMIFQGHTLIVRINSSVNVKLCN